MPPVSDVDVARAKWQAAGVRSYRMVVRQTCYCDPALLQPIQLLVENQQIVQARGMQQNLPAGVDLQQFHTVEGLLDFVERSRQKKPHHLEVKYDPRFGVPLYIDYDYHRMMADDEVRYEVLEFTRMD